MIISGNTITGQTITLSPQSGGSRAENLGLNISGNSVQIVSATNSTTVTLSSGQGVFVDTGTQATITPKFATSKILILVQQSYFHDGTAEGTGFKIQRNSVDITTQQGFTASYNGILNRVHGYTPIMYVDTPGGNAACTYKVVGARWGDEVTQFQYGGAQSPSYITLIEIAQ